MIVEVGPAPLAGRKIAATALELAKVFESGGRLLVAAPDRIDHARHVAVEFVHPAVTGARSLPAAAVTAAELAASCTGRDAAIVIEPLDGPCVPRPSARVIVQVPGAIPDGELVRWYHVLWELVQVCLEHPGLSGGAASAGGDSTGFLYPFLDASEVDLEGLLTSMAGSAESKAAEADCLATASLESNATAIADAANDIADRIAAGHRIYAVGNGGSACDAARLVRLASQRGIAAMCLAADPSVLTALANDLGAEHMFSRQVEAAVRPGDVLVALSTSGGSPNLLRAIDALPTGACAVACAGYGGGRLAEHARVDHALIVASPSVHRIQEAQSRLIDALLDRVHDHQRVEP